MWQYFLFFSVFLQVVATTTLLFSVVYSVAELATPAIEPVRRDRVAVTLAALVALTEVAWVCAALIDGG